MGNDQTAADLASQAIVKQRRHLLCAEQVPLLKRRGQPPPSNLVRSLYTEPSFDNDFECDESSLFVCGVGYGSLAKVGSVQVSMTAPQPARSAAGCIACRQ